MINLGKTEYSAVIIRMIFYYAIMLNMITIIVR